MVFIAVHESFFTYGCYLDYQFFWIIWILFPVSNQFTYAVFIGPNGSLCWGDVCNLIRFFLAYAMLLAPYESFLIHVVY